MEPLREITRMYENRWQLLQNEDKPKINWISISTPEEILYAAQMIPYRITGETYPNFQKASVAMHPNICPYVLSCFEEALNGMHQFAAGTVIVNACDARRRLYDVWRYYDRSNFLYRLDLPKGIDADSKRYFKNQLQHLVNALEMKFQCKISDDSLHAAIALCNETRRLLSEIAELRCQGLAPLSGSQAIQLVKTAMVGLRSAYNPKLARLLETIKAIPQTERAAKYRILLCGSYFDHTAILDLFEAAGVEIVCEDVSNGIKYFQGQVDQDGEPLEALAEYYLEKATCARMIDTARRYQHLRDLANRYRVQAVLYFTLKFCDNNLLDFPYIKKRLNEEGIPVFWLETERAVLNLEQIKTRVGAFLESAVG
jgi:benzoyl-CoA reductase/2-hydroxyglutaryl-CoA dehydratase subunit BcrC/BadD/HgdB